MYTIEEREALRSELVEAARSDPRISGAALTGSAAVGAEDEWSDIDLAFGIEDASKLQDALADWTTRMYERHEALHHMDVVAGAAIYRVFLLRNTLQVDLAFAPKAEFGARAPTFRLLFGEATHLPHALPPRAEALIGMAWLYALHARSCLARERRWQAEYMISGVRDQALALACLRHGLPAVQGRGLDQLPVDSQARFEEALVVSMEPTALRRALRAAIAGLLHEIGSADAELCSRLEGALGELASTPPPAIEAARNQLNSIADTRAPQPGGDRKVVLASTISVKDLAERLRIRPVDVIKKLMTKGVMATVNQVIDYGTAEIVADAFGYTVEPIASEDLIMPSRYRMLTPYIAVVDAMRALDWYEEVFAARRSGDFVVGSDGKIGHAELEIGDAILMLGEDRHAGAKAPGSSIFILVPDADVTVGLAVTRGAELERPVADEPYGRTGVVIDPFRQRWIVSTPPPGVSAPAQQPRHGELGYVTVRVPDRDRAERFYGAVLGWTFEPGADRRPPRVGLWGEVDAPTVDLLFRVDDLDAALDQVRAQGGHADEPTRERFGRVARCVDNQGARFQLWQP